MNILLIYIIYYKNIYNIFDGGGCKNVTIKIYLKNFNTIKKFFKHKLI